MYFTGKSPILGVVPKCEDISISNFPENKNFLIDLQRMKSEGDLIAQHGFTHINDSKNYYESLIDTIESYSITDNRLMNEINRLRILANELNISISKIEVDPQNSFPGKFRTNLKINTELERQTLVLDLKGRFLRVGKFLDNYEKINAPLKLQSCDISLDTLDPIGVTAQLRFVMYTGIKS